MNGATVPNIILRTLLGTPDPDPRRNRTKPTQAMKEIRDDVREAAMAADGAMRLGGHIMEGLVELDNYRRELTQGDQTLNMLLSEVEAETVGQVKKIQRNLYSEWEKP